MLLTNRLSQIQNQIDAYLEQIAKLQANVTQLQTHAQEVQTVEQAAESALSQISTALSMLSAVCPDEIATFKTAVDAKFREPVLELAAAIDNIETSSEQPPVTPESDDTATIEAITVTVKDDISMVTQPEETLPSDAEVTSTARRKYAYLFERLRTRIFSLLLMIGSLAPSFTSALTQPDQTPPIDTKITGNTINGNGNSEQRGLEGNPHGATTLASASATDERHPESHRLLTYDELKKLDKRTLVDLMTSQLIAQGKCKKRDKDLIAKTKKHTLLTQLDGTVTETEFARITTR